MKKKLSQVELSKSVRKWMSGNPGTRVERPKKGAGSYRRKNDRRDQD